MRPPLPTAIGNGPVHLSEEQLQAFVLAWIPFLRPAKPMNAAMNSTGEPDRLTTLLRPTLQA